MSNSAKSAEPGKEDHLDGPRHAAEADGAGLPIESITDDPISLIYGEAHYLDTKAFDLWLSLYREDAEFWLPAWADTNEPITSPSAGLSLIYCAARAGLEDRVWRLRSGLSVASTPLLRTVHSISNPIVSVQQANEATVFSSWTCHVWNVKRSRQHVFFGRYEHSVTQAEEGRWVIARKKVILMNDRVPTMLDFYCV